jgi:hypothetical protein
LSKIALAGAVSGTATFTIESPATSTNRTLTLPDNTGTIITQNSTPAFASTIGVGGATAAASGAGITFPATASASSDANTLDDYEEGTWTPTILGQTTAGTTTYGAVRRGTYTKIGRQVTVDFYVNYTAATGTGNLIIGGLPFIVGNADVMGSLMTDALNWSGGTYLALRGLQSANELGIWGVTDDAAWTRQTMVNEAADITGSITYFV